MVCTDLDSLTYQTLFSALEGLVICQLHVNHTSNLTNLVSAQQSDYITAAKGYITLPQSVTTTFYFFGASGAW